MYPSLLAALAVTVGAPGPKEEPKEGPPSVVGEWVAEKGVFGGNDRALPPGGVIFEFTADGHTHMREGTKQPDPADYKVDPKKSPAEIDIISTANPKQPPTYGIYKVEGDTLTLCVSRGGKRPTTFEAPAGSDLMLLTLKRVKPKG
jgi:uncharacterized protein (TIGR03067 family)